MDNEKYIDPTKVKLKDLVKDNKKVKFTYFRENKLWYQCEGGLIFPVDISTNDNNNVTFLAEDKAIFYMRWIRKYLNECKETN